VGIRFPDQECDEALAIGFDTTTAGSLYARETGAPSGDPHGHLTATALDREGTLKPAILAGFGELKRKRDLREKQESARRAAAEAEASRAAAEQEAARLTAAAAVRQYEAAKLTTAYAEARARSEKAAKESEKSATRHQIDSIYSHHNPSKLSEVEALVERFGEEVLLRQAKKKYGAAGSPGGVGGERGEGPAAAVERALLEAKAKAKAEADVRSVTPPRWSLGNQF
jgi:DNA repair exonuclease SbcCD ATPase subunit